MLARDLDDQSFNSLEGLRFSIVGLGAEVERFTDSNRFLIDVLDRNEAHGDPDAQTLHRASVSLLRTMQAQLMQVSYMVDAVMHHPVLPVPEVNNTEK